MAELLTRGTEPGGEFVFAELVGFVGVYDAEVGEGAGHVGVGCETAGEMVEVWSRGCGGGREAVLMGCAVCFGCRSLGCGGHHVIAQQISIILHWRDGHLSSLCKELLNVTRGMGCFIDSGRGV